MTSLIETSAQLPLGREAHLPHLASNADRSRPKELLGVILQRLWPALGLGAAVTLVVLAIIWRMTPTYLATGSLLIEPKRQNLAQTTGPTQFDNPPDTSAIDTQVEVLNSPAIAAGVAGQLRLYGDPEFNPALKGGTPATTPLSPGQKTQVIESVSRHLKVRRAGLTYVVNVGFASKSPEKAALIANTYMTTYLQHELDDKLAQVTKANRELGSQVERLRAQAEQAEAGVQQYKIAHNLFSAEGATMAEQEVSNLNQQIAVAKADAAEKVARLNAAVAQVSRGGGGADVTAAVSSDTVRDLRKEEAVTSEKLAQLKAIFQSDYPEVQRTQAELNDIRSEIQAQLNRIMSSVRADATASEQRSGSLLSSRGAAQGGLVTNNRAQVGLVALQQRADASQKIYNAYLDRANQVSSEGMTQQPDAQVASQALRPLKPSSPNMMIGGGLAVLLGMMTTAAVIFLSELWDRKLRSRSDVEDRLAVPLAGVVPLIPSQPGTLSRKKTAAGIAKAITEDRHSGFAESFRNLRAYLKFSEHDPRAKLLAVTSALPREGKTVTSLCLARSMALSGSRVVVVDCDLRKRGLSRLTGHLTAGLVEVIEGKAKLHDALMRDDASGAWILPTLPVGAMPHELFSDPRADEVFKQLAEQFDHVILELPPVLGLADARILAVKADRVLYVVRWNETPLNAARSGLDVLYNLGANVIGATLTQVNAKQQARYGYSDGSDYFTYFQQYYLPNAGR